MRVKFTQALLAAAAIVTFGGLAATAQPTAMAQHGEGHRMAGGVEERITELYTKLQITKYQEPQWEQFISVMRENARNMDVMAGIRQQALEKMTAVENMQSFSQLANEHARHMQALLPSFQALYATMSSGQKRLSDQVFRDNFHRRDQARRG